MHQNENINLNLGKEAEVRSTLYQYQGDLYSATLVISTSSLAANLRFPPEHVINFALKTYTYPMGSYMYTHTYMNFSFNSSSIVLPLPHCLGPSPIFRARDLKFSPKNLEKFWKNSREKNF